MRWQLGGGPVELELTRIPFVLLDIGDSLIKDVCHHQIALLEPWFERCELLRCGRTSRSIRSRMMGVGSVLI